MTGLDIRKLCSSYYFDTKQSTKQRKGMISIAIKCRHYRDGTKNFEIQSMYYYNRASAVQELYNLLTIILVDNKPEAINLSKELLIEVYGKASICKT